MIDVAIVGCGKIADQHAEQLRNIRGCRIASACDREELMARQFAERYGVEGVFGDLGQLLEERRPDVVHITTPPQSHYPLARTALEAGCHVYVEKPFTVDAREAQSLLALAQEKGLKITAGHNAQFTHAALRMRRLVEQGYLGGPPVHMEAYYCYDLADPAYAKALLGDASHWVRRLPGALLHNIVSHGLAKVIEFMREGHIEVVAYGFTSAGLAEAGEEGIVDELRVILRDRAQATAYFTFSTQMRPALHQLRLYGPENGLLVDDDQQAVVRLGGKRYKSFLEPFFHPLSCARDYLSASWANIRHFLRADFHPDHGMGNLLRAFYRAIEENGDPPISYREILQTARVMDEIFLQLKQPGAVKPAPSAPAAVGH